MKIGDKVRVHYGDTIKQGVIVGEAPHEQWLIRIGWRGNIYVFAKEWVEECETLRQRIANRVNWKKIFAAAEATVVLAEIMAASWILANSDNTVAIILILSAIATAFIVIVSLIWRALYYYFLNRE